MQWAIAVFVLKHIHCSYMHVDYLIIIRFIAGVGYRAGLNPISAASIII